MTVRLTIRTAIWRSHVAQIAASVDGLVPVVKGNGYGFGRTWLAGVAAEFSDTVAVGTVHELAGLPDAVTAVVLTPTLASPPKSRRGQTQRNFDDPDAALGPSDAPTTPILTVGHSEHIAALANWNGRVIVKLTSEMRRYGGDIGLVDEARSVGLHVVGVSIHPPLVGGANDHATAITAALADIDPSVPVWLSHLDADAYASLPDTHQFRLRLGTTLWHGDKSALHLTADVLDLRPIRAGQSAGYRLGTVETDGHLVMIGAGTANGIAMIDEGARGSSSPFHHQRTRLDLHEPPHMHTSMAFVPEGDPLPTIGDRVDVQRPLHMTTVDEYEWL